MRTFACRVFEEPTRSNSPVSITRKSFACKLSGMFAISSMNSVLSSASSNRPARSVFASVKAPLTWPKSSLSKIVSDSPPMFTVIMLCDVRGESACSACAINPLPVPFSPVIKMFASDGATREIISKTGRIARRFRD